MLRVRTLGGLALERDGEPVGGIASQRKRLALLAILATESPAGVSRDKLVALLWPDSDSERARGSLYQSLSGIRLSVGHDGVVGGPAGDVRLDNSVVASDVVDFRSALARGDLEAAVSVYGGPFLDGIFVRDAPEFDRWAERVRADLAERYRDALERLAGAAESGGDVDLAATWWRRLSDADPLSSRVALRLMRSLVKRGESEAAVRHGRTHQALVREELDAAPDPAVASFLDSLVATRSSAPVSKAEAPRGAPATEQPQVPVQRAAERPKVTWRPLVAVVGGVALVVAAARGARQALPESNAPAAAIARRVVVDEFVNRTGDPSLDPLGTMLADWVTRGLQQTGVVEVVDPESRLASARRLAAPGGSRTPGRQAAAMAMEAGAGTVVTGVVYQQSGVLRYSASITDVNSGKVLASLDPVTAPSSDPVSGAELLRERVAGALAAALDTRIPPLSGNGNTPPTFAAYREFMHGMEAFPVETYDLALQHFEAAARLDSSFSTPLVWAYFAAGNFAAPASTRDSLLRELGRRRERLAPLDLLALEYFEAQALGDDVKTNAALYAAARLSPGSAWGYMAGMFAWERPSEVIRFLERLDPEHGWVRGWLPYWRSLLNAYHILGRYPDELATVRRWKHLDARYPVIPFIEIRALVATGRSEEAQGILDGGDLTIGAGEGFDESPGALIWKSGLEFRAHGDLPGAGAAFSKAMAWYRSPKAIAWCSEHGRDVAQSRLEIQVAIGKLLYELGRWDESRRTLEVVRSSRSLDRYAQAELHGVLGLLAARRGDLAMADRSRALLDSMVTADATQSWALLASVEISEILGERDRAIARLERLTSMDNDVRLIELHRSFEMKALRSDPRFAAIQRPRD